MRQGGWTEAGEGDYRKLIKNKEEAVSLEQASRVVRSGAMIENQLAELHERAEAEPGNVDLARRIGELYDQKEDFESASQWFRYAAELTGSTDEGLLRKAHDTELKSLGEQVRHLEVDLAKLLEGTPECSEMEAKLHELSHRRESILIEELQDRVKRNPTDLSIRFELGEHLVRDERYTDAIPELQKARTSPNHRVRAIAYLGQCYDAKNMPDLAKKQFSEALTELGQMDSIKKDITYRLGLLQERTGHRAEYLECMKQIYEVDYGYRDVAQRVESSYEDGGRSEAPAS